MGPITASLRETFDKAIRGRLSDYRHWNTAVYTNVKIAQQN
jgi:hypothetical protein